VSTDSEGNFPTFAHEWPCVCASSKNIPLSSENSPENSKETAVSATFNLNSGFTEVTGVVGVIEVIDVVEVVFGAVNAVDVGVGVEFDANVV
jgi:hypothetical protein